jgi:4-hydroxy-tetrahydrodipicolinate synthase
MQEVNDDGLFAWFSEVIRAAVPEDKYLLGYHMPGMTGVGFSLDLLSRLKEAFPGRFADKDLSPGPTGARGEPVSGFSCERH